MPECPFCQPSDVFYEDEYVWGIWDRFPLNRGHALIIPRRHFADWFNATGEEQRTILQALEVARREILQRYKADGFNIGINIGSAAGQTVGHLHVHLIPRISGDVPDPRGGVRWVIPDRAAWWNQKGDE